MQNETNEPCAPAKDASARLRANVLSRHRKEWEEHNEIMQHAIAMRDAEEAKFAKLTAEILKIRQEAERKAWGIADKEDTDVFGGLEVSWQS